MLESVGRKTVRDKFVNESAGYAWVDGGVATATATVWSPSQNPCFTRLDQRLTAARAAPLPLQARVPAAAAAALLRALHTHTTV